MAQAGHQGPHCGEVPVRWSTCSGSANGNLRDGFTVRKKKEYLFLLKWYKMCVAAHRRSFAYR